METKKKHGSVIKNCKQCDRKFSVALSTIAAGKGNCCSKACRDRYRIGKPVLKLKTRCDKKPRTSFTCQLCGKVFIDEHAERPRKFCSNQCLGRSKRKNKSESPRAKQMVALQAWAKKIILRDKSCVRCGHRESLQAHHLKSYAEHPDLRLDVTNGVALCPVCHHAQHPTHKLGLYLVRGGKSVRRCVVCESEFVSCKKSQRTCGVSCGAKLRQTKRNYSRRLEDE